MLEQFGHEMKATYLSWQSRTRSRGNDITLKWDSKKCSPRSQTLLCGKKPTMEPLSISRKSPRRFAERNLKPLSYSYLSFSFYLLPYLLVYSLTMPFLRLVTILDMQSLNSCRETCSTSQEHLEMACWMGLSPVGFHAAYTSVSLLVSYFLAGTATLTNARRKNCFAHKLYDVCKNSFTYLGGRHTAKMNAI